MTQLHVIPYSGSCLDYSKSHQFVLKFVYLRPPCFGNPRYIHNIRLQSQQRPAYIALSGNQELLYTTCIYTHYIDYLQCCFQFRGKSCLRDTMYLTDVSLVFKTFGDTDGFSLEFQNFIYSLNKIAYIVIDLIS